MKGLKRLFGLIAIVVAVVMFVTLIPVLISDFDKIFSSDAEFFDKLVGAFEAFWKLLFQPLVLIILGFIAID